MFKVFVVIVCYYTAVVIGKSIEGKSTIDAGRAPGEISKEKCKGYVKYSYEITEDNKKKYDCNVEPDPIDSYIATRKEFPHMVRLGYIKENNDSETDYFCAGILITENFVLTAGHCLNPPRIGPPKTVRLGIADVEEHRQDLIISEMFTHPNYKRMYNDIGLVKLESPAQLNSHVRPACLATDTKTSYEEFVILGWDNDGNSHNTSQHFKKGIVTIVSNEACNNSYATVSKYLNKGIIEEFMVCATIKNGKDTCQGDSGVPLQERIQDSEEMKCMYSIVGLTSLGKKCGDHKFPSVYTRVSGYIKWIEDIVWPLS